MSSGLETPLLLMYTCIGLAVFIGAAYSLANGFLVRREVDEATKALVDKTRSEDVTARVYFELGATLIRKKSYRQALRNLEMSIKLWDGEEVELAQVYNALGFAYSEMAQSERAVSSFRRALWLQPGYTYALNNLGRVYEKRNEFGNAIQCYKETLMYDCQNKVARSQIESCKALLRKLDSQNSTE